jgi:hypothetical protein
VSERVPANGVRARLVCLTLPQLVQANSPQFDGEVKWLGVSERIRYELRGDGVFQHRRVVFSQSTYPPAQVFFPIPGASKGEFARQPCVDLSDDSVRACINRVFSNSTVHGILNGPINAQGITVHESKTKTFNGLDSENIKGQRFWNSFGPKGAGALMKFRLNSQGLYKGVLQESSFPHIFVLDIFAQGLATADCRIPRSLDSGPREVDPKMEPALKREASQMEMDGVELTPSTSRTSSTGSAAKKPKLDPSQMEGMTIDDTASVKGPSPDKDLRLLLDNESMDDGPQVKVRSVMKLYYFDPSG